MGSALVKVERHGEAIDARQRVSEYVNADDTIKLRKEVMRALIANSVALFPEEYGQDSTLENYGESIAAMRSASEYVRPDDPKEMRVLVGELLSIAGHLLNLYGRFGEAEVASRKATDIDPSHGESWRVLAEAILQQPDDARLTEAEECARRASDLAPGNPIALRTLSDVLSRLEKSTESLGYLARSLRVGGGEVQLSSVAGIDGVISQRRCFRQWKACQADDGRGRADGINGASLARCTLRIWAKRLTRCRPRLWIP